MSDNTVTLILDGDVPLSEFAKALVGFNELVRALSAEAGASSVDWLIQDLQISSAIASVAGFGEPQAINRVVSAYADVGATLEGTASHKFSAPVRNAVTKIISIDDTRIPTVRFETATRDAVIKIGKVIPFPEKVAVPQMPVKPLAPAYGAIKGRIQTVTTRGSLRFTLYDVVHDKAVSGYFAEGKQDLIRDLWGHMVIVEGMVTRDPLSGRPLAIRQVRDITPLPEPFRSFDYMDARGAAPSLNGLSPEEAIRRIRDAQ